MIPPHRGYGGGAPGGVQEESLWQDLPRFAYPVEHGYTRNTLKKKNLELLVYTKSTV